MNNFFLYYALLFWFFALINFIFAKKGYGMNMMNFAIRKPFIDKKKAKKDEVQLVYSIAFLNVVIGIIFMLVWGFHYFYKIDNSSSNLDMNLKQYDFSNVKLGK